MKSLKNNNFMEEVDFLCSAFKLCNQISDQPIVRTEGVFLWT